MVRHRILIPAFVGSIPTSPASLKDVACLGRLRPFLFKGSMVSDDSLMVFTGNANPKLAQ